MANRRSAVASNQVTHIQLDYETMNDIYRSGLGSKIVRIKAGYSLDDTISFKDKDEQVMFDTYALKEFKRAARFMIGFGRGVIVVYERDADMSKPRTGVVDFAHSRLRAFSGDMVSVTKYVTDLASPDYYTPEMYTINGRQFHKSRVIDLTYVEPRDLDKTQYSFGGISEFELIYPQVVNDGVVERASSGIVEKASRKYLKVKGFKQALASGNASDMLTYFATMEDASDIFGASVLDSDDEVVVANQTISNLSETDTITLRRLAMVTGIPLALLIGENVRGLNSSGEQERAAFQDMIETLQSDYLLDPLQRLCAMMGLSKPEFKYNQGGTQNERADYDAKLIENAIKLQTLGLDYERYMSERGLVFDVDTVEELFNSLDGEIEPDADEDAA